MLIHLAFYTTAPFSKNIYVYIHIFQIYRETFCEQENLSIVITRLSPQETSMISMLPEKLD